MNPVRVAGTRTLLSSINSGQSTGGNTPLLFIQTLSPCLVVALPLPSLPETFPGFIGMAVTVVTDDPPDDVRGFVELLFDLLATVPDVPHKQDDCLQVAWFSSCHIASLLMPDHPSRRPVEDSVSVWSEHPPGSTLP
jgi:hypothetical protein